MAPDFATPEDIHAARPDVPLQTIRRHMRNGSIPGAMKAGRSWIVPEASALQYVTTYKRYARNGADAATLDASAPSDPPNGRQEQ